MVAVAAARAGDEAASIAAYSFKSLPPSQLKIMPVDEIVTGIKGLEPVDVNKILKKLDDAQLAKIGKKLDGDFVKKLDPELATKLKPPTTLSKITDGLKGLRNTMGNSIWGSNRELVSVLKN